MGTCLLVCSIHLETAIAAQNRIVKIPHNVHWVNTFLHSRRPVGSSQLPMAHGPRKIGSNLPTQDEKLLRRGAITGGVYIYLRVGPTHPSRRFDLKSIL